MGWSGVFRLAAASAPFVIAIIASLTIVDAFSTDSKFKLTYLHLCNIDYYHCLLPRSFHPFLHNESVPSVLVLFIRTCVTICQNYTLSVCLG